jgi:hypothetical protein
MSSIKQDWKKTEKLFYQPSVEPCLVGIPAFSFFSIRGQGNPNDSSFQDFISVLYSLSYAVRMSYKSSIAPAGYTEYTVYPLEGVWDVSEESKAKGAAPGGIAKRADTRDSLDKDLLVFQLMIRQPGFVTPEFAGQIIDTIRKKKPNPLLDFADFISLEEGSCVQMMHWGSFDDEPHSFGRMEEFCTAQGLSRKSLLHREIYLSDPRSTEAAKLRTVLRFQVDVQ